MIIKTVVAHVGILNSSVFGEYELTLPALQKMAATAPGKPVTLKFDPANTLGIIIAAEVVDDQLIAEFNVELPKSDKPLYAVPDITDPEYILNQLGIVPDPLDKKLQPLP